MTVVWCGLIQTDCHTTSTVQYSTAQYSTVHYRGSGRVKTVTVVWCGLIHTDCHHNHSLGIYLGWGAGHTDSSDSSENPLNILKTIKSAEW